MNVTELFEKAHRLNKELHEINEELEKASLTDLVPLVAKEIRPEIITVWEEGPKESIVLLRSPSTPEFAFVVLGKGHCGTQWKLSLKLEDGRSSRIFGLQCGCCSDELSGLDQPGDTGDTNAWQRSQKARFFAQMLDVCQKNGISTIFVRKSDRWREKYGFTEGIVVFEANMCRTVMGDTYGKRIIDRALSFLGEGTNI